MNIHILVADDDPVLRELLCDMLKAQGYTTIEACDGQEALDRFFEEDSIDLVILDVMMPKFDGWEVLTEIREHSDTPVLMLTALGSERHEIHGLKKGADDYIAKPFSYERLIARVEVLLRKVLKEQKEELKAGLLSVNRETHKVMVEEIEISLNHKEFQLLFYLIENQNIVLNREKILNHIWGYDFDGDIRTIDTHIKTLRAKLLLCGEYIQTVRGSGYRFEVTE